jgi:hypothetical protein
MRGVAQIKLAYDGTRYCGWQLQPGGQPTVQGHLEKALEQLTGCNRKVLGVTGAGRTDSGVHAHMQVLHAASPSPTQLGQGNSMNEMNRAERVGCGERLEGGALLHTRVRVSHHHPSRAQRCVLTVNWPIESPGVDGGLIGPTRGGFQASCRWTSACTTRRRCAAPSTPDSSASHSSRYTSLSGVLSPSQPHTSTRRSTDLT